jgi:hypothetical protein
MHTFFALYRYAFSKFLFYLIIAKDMIPGMMAIVQPFCDEILVVSLRFPDLKH